jgi:beta-N-acetylhexosaminidase
MKSMVSPELGQLFMVGLPAPELEASTRQLVREYCINNFIIFKRNVQSREQLLHLCRQLHQACKENKLPSPLISIDQEGGTVARLPPPFTQFADARMLAAAADPQKALVGYAETCARELLEVGITMNLAPVLDVCEKGRDFYMERRSLGHDPERVAALGRLIIQTMQQHGVASCAKHFPGLGAAVVDPHLELSRVSRSLRQLEHIDLVPFRAAIAGQVAAIMTSHTVYDALDPDTPATLSKKILTNLLRGELGYDGLIITDDLEMGAIEREEPLAIAALKALQAGADLLLICHDHAKVIQTYEACAEALAHGKITDAAMRESLRRIGDVRDRFGSFRP